MIYDRQYETISRDELEQIQIERLQSTLNRACRNVAFYKNNFESKGINIEEINSPEDLLKLPFTTKDDLRKSYPYDFFAVPLRDIVRIHSSVGRTGKPIAVGYTKNDIERWSSLVARLLAAAGVDENDFVQIAYDYNMHTGGFGMHYGVEKLGASVIPSSASRDIQEQIMIMKDYKTTVLLSSPSYALDIARNLAEMNIHPEELNLRVGIFGAESWGEKTRSRIEQRLRISAYNMYGVNEIVSPGMAGECEMKNGLHISEDSFIVEIIDPATGKPRETGEEGELVITTINREGFPLIRYRTGDISSFVAGGCACGRTTARISRVAARSDDMISLRGTGIFPNQIEDILKRVEGLVPNFQIIVKKVNDLDVLEIKVEMSEGIFNDHLGKLLEIRKTAEGLIKDSFNVTAEVNFVEKGRLSSGPAHGQVLDLREE